jgi:cytochrome oxidase Cu insertion factor (SCO1/SenC/PrrC family)
MRRYQAALIAVTAVVIAAIAAYVLYGGNKPGGSGTALVGGPFTLVDQNGRTRTEKDFAGSYMLVYFGYTFCPDVCPTALQVMSQAMDRLDPPVAAKIVPVFVTVDPARDTASQLKGYVGNFHPRLVGLTGTEEQVAAAAKAYRVYYAKSKETAASSDYLMDHSSVVFLMGPNGRYLTHFTHNAPSDRMAEALAGYVRGK